MNYFKWLCFSGLLFSQFVSARCPDENEPVALQGKLVEETRPGPPNYESIREGDEALTNYYIELDRPIECDFANGDEATEEVQLIFLANTPVNYADLAPSLGKNVIATGKIMSAQVGRHFTPLLLQLDDIQEVDAITTPQQKKEALLQFQRFQQALRDKNIAGLKAFFVFPFEGDIYDFIPYDEAKKSPDVFTEQIFDQHSQAIVDGLQPLSHIALDMTHMTLHEHRIITLSEKEQKRHYYPTEEDGVLYFKENGQRHYVSGMCDEVADGEFDEESLRIYRGTSANLQLPGLSETCEGASSYIFKVVGGKLRLVSSYTAG